MGYRVLIVDDAEDVHEVVGTYLERSGYRIDHATNGLEAQRCITAAAPDLVLLDIQMPIQDGFELLAIVKSVPATEDIPILMVSSLDRPNLKVKALQMGADDYIVKPFERGELLARVTRALTRGARFRLLANTFSGGLGEVPLEELLQTLDLSRKSAVIVLVEMGGTVTVCGGLIQAVRWRRFEGTDALRRLLAVSRGHFRVEFQPGGEVGGAPLGPISNLLLDGVVGVDELRRAMAAVAPPEAVIEISPGTMESQLPEVVYLQVPARFIDVVVGAEGNCFETIDLVAAALKSGHLRVAAGRSEC